MGVQRRLDTDSILFKLVKKSSDFSIDIATGTSIEVLKQFADN